MCIKFMGYTIKCSLLRAFPSDNFILVYFIISKNYFINYTIPFYNTLNIPTFILPYDILNNIKIFLTSLSDLYFPYSLNHPPPLSSFLVTPPTSAEQNLAKKSKSKIQNPKSKIKARNPRRLCTT